MYAEAGNLISGKSYGISVQFFGIITILETSLHASDVAIFVQSQVFENSSPISCYVEIAIHSMRYRQQDTDLDSSDKTFSEKILFDEICSEDLDR